MKKTYKMAVEEYNNKIRGIYSLITFPEMNIDGEKQPHLILSLTVVTGLRKISAETRIMMQQQPRWAKVGAHQQKAEWQELIDKCEWEYRGGNYIITGPSGKKIVLPTSGIIILMTSERANVPTRWIADVCLQTAYRPKGIQSIT